MNHATPKLPMFLLILFVILLGGIWKLNSYITKKITSETMVPPVQISVPAQQQAKPVDQNLQPQDFQILEPSAPKPDVSNAAASSSQTQTNQEIFYELPLEDKILVQ